MLLHVHDIMAEISAGGKKSMKRAIASSEARQSEVWRCLLYLC